MSDQPLPRLARRIVLGPGEDSVEVVLATPEPDPETIRLIADLRAELDRIKADLASANAEVARQKLIIRALQGRRMGAGDENAGEATHES